MWQTVEESFSLAEPSSQLSSGYIYKLILILHGDSQRPQHARLISSHLGGVVLPRWLATLELHGKQSLGFQSVCGRLALYDGNAQRSISYVETTHDGPAKEEKFGSTGTNRLLPSLSDYAAWGIQWMNQLRQNSITSHLEIADPLPNPLLKIGLAEFCFRRDVHFVQPCLHSPDPEHHSITIPTDCVVRPPNMLSSTENKPGQQGKISVYPVRRNKLLRLAILAVLVRERPAFSESACFDYSVRFCRENDISYLVL